MHVAIHQGVPRAVRRHVMQKPRPNAEKAVMKIRTTDAG
jgi:hypothetical protein